MAQLGKNDHCKSVIPRRVMYIRNSNVEILKGREKDLAGLYLEIHFRGRCKAGLALVVFPLQLHPTYASMLARFIVDHLH
jgi:hypothetical protein